MLVCKCPRACGQAGLRRAALEAALVLILRAAAETAAPLAARRYAEAAGRLAAAIGFDQEAAR